MNSCEPISITATPASLWKCGTTWSDIELTLGQNSGRRHRHDVRHVKPLHHKDGTHRFLVHFPQDWWSGSGARATGLFLQIRHYLVVTRSPSFVGAVVS